MSLHQNNKLIVHDKRCSVSHWPPASEMGMLLMINFLELRVVAERRRKLAGRQHAVPKLFACRHPAATLPRTCRERHIRGMAGERHGMCDTNTAALCKSNGKVTI
jgi:hypothetical protein